MLGDNPKIMEVSYTNCPTTIMDLPDDCLTFVFQSLGNAADREALGLTCRRWLYIQNTNRRSLKFLSSFSLEKITSPRRFKPPTIGTFQLHRLLTRFSQLQSLSLSGCTELDDTSLMKVQGCVSNLRFLNLDCCSGISDNGLSSFANGCSLLKFISLYRCNVTDVGLERLAQSCPTLEDINLIYCSQISDHGIKMLFQNCSNLSALRISYCSQVNGSGFRGCSQNLAYLEADSCQLEPDGIAGIVSGGGLQYLNVSSLSWCVHGDGLGILGAGFGKRLRFLNMRLCRSVKDDSVSAIAKGCPNLQDWNLALCHEVRVSGWQSIALNCHKLETLHVNRCRNLCDQGLQALRNGCKKLSVLHMNGCPRVSSNAIEMFRLFRGEVAINGEEILTIGPAWAFRW